MNVVDVVFRKTRHGWSKFNNFLILLTRRWLNLETKDRFYFNFMRSFKLYGSKPWPEDNVIKLEKNNTKIVRLKCFVGPGKKTIASKIIDRLKLNTIMDRFK